MRYRKLSGFNQPPIPPTIEGYGTGPFDTLPWDQSLTLFGGQVNPQSIVDNFVRPNAQPVGFPWVDVAIGGQLQLLNDAISPSTLLGSLGGILYGASPWGPNQSSQFQIVQLKQNAGYIGALLRAEPTGQNFYYAALDASPAFGGIGLPTPLNLHKFQGGVPFIDIHGFGFIVPQVGDVITIKIEGSTITAFQNGTMVGTPYTDLSPIPNGSPGIFIQTSVPANVTDLAVTNWNGVSEGTQNESPGIAGDYSFGHNEDDFYINEPAAVAQAVLTALLLHEGEWFLDVTVGMPWETQVEGFNTQSLYDSAIKNTVLGVQGVQAILQYQSVFDSEDRSLSVNMILSTIFGTAVVGVTL